MNAAAVVFPSLYEGFGLPVIEAMAAGAPLALSDIPAFREISPADGLFFDPVSPDAIARALATILGEPRRATQIAAYGRRRAADFSADALAAAYADLYRRFRPGGNAPEKA
jgi:glycosyltransferase involved in cell wall biosynthesis